MSRYIETTNNPFYDANSIVNQLVPEYIKTDSFQAVLSGVLDSQYGNYFLRDKYTLVPDKIKSDVMTWYGANAYKYKGLEDSTHYDYQPLENYRMIEEGEDTSKGSGTDINTYGERKYTNEEGERTDTTNIGERKDNTTTGAHNDTVNLSVSPFEQNGFTNREKTENQFASRSDSATTGAQQNRVVKGSATNTTTENEREDVLEKESQNSTTHKLTRSGNIGVTTSQQMLQSERDIVDFSIYLTIAKELMQLLCIRVDTENKYIVVDD